MSLRVIAGIYGSRVLQSVRGLGTRPLLGQVKAATFSILQEQVPGAIVWDLFAGTGATGIEALSRGAARVLFCEKNGRALDVLRQNLRSLGDEAVQRSVVLRTDAWDPPTVHRGVLGDDGAVPADAGGAAPAAGEAEVAPDLIFLDPPYALVAEDPAKCLWRAARLGERLAPGGCLAFHFETGLLDEDDFGSEFEVDLRDWGRSAIAFLWRQRGATAPTPAAD